MKIDVTMTFNVCIDIDDKMVGKDVLESLQYIFEKAEVNGDLSECDKEAADGIDWLNDHINSDDAYDWNYSINELE